MATMIVLFNLVEEQSVEDYERWAQTIDTPAIKRLSSVADKRVYRATELKGSENASPYQYIEVIEVIDAEQLDQESKVEPVRGMVEHFRSITKDVLFIESEQFS
jgi:hypothetical protein